MSLSTENRVLAGRYRLAGKLGAGGMAEVHRAWDVLLRRYVAVKLVDARDDVGGTRFDREVRTLAGLSHPGLVSVYDVGDCGGMSFVVLQLVEGMTLAERLDDGPLSHVTVRALGHRLADTLAHVHENGVVHRDVKPANILLDRTGVTYLADFGLARSLDATRLTDTRMVLGTAGYLAPEQVRGEEVGPAADVYALGLVLLECLTGRREYGGSDRVEAAVARLHRPPEVPADLPDDLVRLLSLMTSLSVRRRPTAAWCAEQLGAAVVRPVGAGLLGDGLLCGGRRTPDRQTGERQGGDRRGGGPEIGGRSAGGGRMGDRQAGDRPAAAEPESEGRARGRRLGGPWAGRVGAEWVGG
ncbi:serine/threonine-protein kinase [Saccharothrix hoggarensis]|uniref:non-specific serine/threonine protein kinase n=1 Tax=Saccharothrix hoggarensis TaxID=913853 RepID=A0ABW3QYR7_9PSEU